MNSTTQTPSPTRRKLGEPVHKFCLTEDVFVQTNLTRHGFANAWASLEPSGRLTIRAGYTWDGCSPKWVRYGVIIGIWDGLVLASTRKPQLWRASLVHDVLIQFRHEHGASLKQCNRAFNELARADGFMLWHVYALALWLYWRKH